MTVLSRSKNAAADRRWRSPAEDRGGADGGGNPLRDPRPLGVSPPRAPVGKTGQTAAVVSGRDATVTSGVRSNPGPGITAVPRGRDGPHPSGSSPRVGRGPSTPAGVVAAPRTPPRYARLGPAGPLAHGPDPRPPLPPGGARARVALPSAAVARRVTALPGRHADPACARRRVAARRGAPAPRSRSRPSRRGARLGGGTAPLVLVGDDRAPRWPADARSRTVRATCSSVGRPRRRRRVWQRAVAHRGRSDVVFLPTRRARLVERWAAMPRTSGSAPAAASAVVGGRGGAGASTLAVGARRDCRSRGLWPDPAVDADPLGGGVDLASGRRSRPGLRWARPAGTHGRLGWLADLREALPRAGPAARVLSWDRSEPVAASPGGGRGGARRPPCAATTWSWSTSPAASTDAARRRRPSAPTTSCSSCRRRSARRRPRPASPPLAPLPRPAGRRRAPGAAALTGGGASRARSGLPFAGRLAGRAAAWPPRSTAVTPGGAAAARSRAACAALLADLQRAAAPGGVTVGADPDLLDRVRARLVAARPVSPRPGGWPPRCARRAASRGDAEVLAAVRLLQGELVGAGSLAARCSRPRGHRRAGQRPGRGVGRPRRGARARRRCASPTTPRSAGSRSGSPARRGRRLDDASPVRRRTAGRRHPAARGAAAGGARRARCLSLRVPRRRAFTLADAGRRPARSRAEAARLLRGVVAAPARLPGHRRHRLGQDDAAVGAARPGDRRASASCWSRTPASCARPTRTSCGSRPGRPTSRARARSTLRDLVRQALRMRPDRLVVGEVRGAEVVDLLAALNTGHEGGCGHAARQPRRRRAGPARGARRAGGAAARGAAQPARRAVDVVVHLVREASGRRRVDAVCTLVRGADGLVQPQVALAGGAAGPGLAALRERLGGHAPW